MVDLDVVDSVNAIEMKTIRTNVKETKKAAFKILRDTKCLRKTKKNQFHHTNIVLHKGEIYWGEVVSYKNCIYIDISECYKGNSNPLRTIFIPAIFDMTGSYMMNIIEYDGPIYF
jgi:hypothetical protein